MNITACMQAKVVSIEYSSRKRGYAGGNECEVEAAYLCFV